MIDPGHDADRSPSRGKTRAWWAGLADAAAGDARRYADRGARRPAFISARIMIAICERFGDQASLRARDELVAYLFERLSARP